MLEPYWSDDTVNLWLGDCREVLAGMPDASVDAVVTDPPAGISFMGKMWDADKGGRDAWVSWLTGVMCEVRRVLKPGGHALVWALPRTSHWTATALDDAGFEIRDCIVHIFGSGFPKSLDVGKAIDRQRNDEIGHVGEFLGAAITSSGLSRKSIAEHFGLDPRGVDLWAPGAGDKSAQARARVPTWEQWATLQALLGFNDGMDAEVRRLNGRKGSPGEAWERREVITERTENRVGGSWADESAGGMFRAGPRVVSVTAPATSDAQRWDGWGTALKPGQEHWWLVRRPLAGTVAANVLEYGTGALNIAACRVEPTGESRPRMDEASQERRYTDQGGTDFAPLPGVRGGAPEGRWPTNLVFSHSASCVEDGPCELACPVAELDRQAPTAGGNNVGANPAEHAQRNTVLGEFTGHRPFNHPGGKGGASRFFPTFRYEAKAPASERPKLADGTAHSTVKPLDLMKFLVRLVTPPGGVVLDPFAGSGTTGEACVLEGFRAVLIELETPHAELIKQRLRKPLQPSLDLFSEVPDAS